MTQLKYIQPEQADTIRAVINACLKHEPEGFFKVYDTESFVIKSRSAEKILEALDGGDEEAGLNFYANGKCLGWFGVLPYEDDCIFDHSDNEFCNNIMKE